ncbi:choice-of-anchor P family protein [Herbidospora cretacea]|uniref:choice-of-anchor P family protein n=1 Tax=Herbidospora cretacea TaxID=28444 RepID=UPI000772E06C|nr:choice-of-anchor P family protein [Herbidospora cretacea]
MFLGRTFTVSIAAAATLLVGMTSTTHARSPTVNAFGARISLPLDITFGPAPEADLGEQTATLASINVGTVSTGALSAEVEQNTTVGTEAARASVDGLNATLLGVGFSAGTIQSECTATTGLPTTGSTTLANAQVLGTSLPSNPAPNTVLQFPPVLPLIEVRLNEQITNPNGSLTVNGMHVRALSGVGDIVLSSSTCGPATLDPPNEVPLASGAGLYLALGLAAAGGGTLLMRRRRQFG